MSYYNFSYDKYKTPKSKSKTENIANNDGKKLYLPHIYLDKQTNVVKNETNDKYFIKHYKVIFEIIF